MYIEDDTDVETVLGREGQTQPEPVQLDRIFEGCVADDATLLPLINRYQATSEFAHLGFRAGQWFETTEETYWHFLESVPPLYQASGGFVVGECTTGHLYESFLEIDGRFYCAVIHWQCRRSFAALWTALLAEVAP